MRFDCRAIVASVFTVALSALSVLSLSEQCKKLAADSGEITKSIRSVLQERLTDKYFDPAAEFHSELKRLKFFRLVLLIETLEGLGLAQR